MSTRCNVIVQSSEGGFGKEMYKVQLYHHCDGYPSNIMPLLEKAFEMGVAHVIRDHARYSGKSRDVGLNAGNLWEMGRSGKVAGLICCSDPLQFEPEDVGVNLPHGDIEWLYVVTVSTSGSEPLVWDVDVVRMYSGVVLRKKLVFDGLGIVLGDWYHRGDEEEC